MAQTKRMTRPRLAKVKVLSKGKLRLLFVNGAQFDVDMAPLIDQSPGLAPLRDAAVLATARLIPGEGWAVVWPGPDIQIGADTLWLDAQVQNAPDENTRDFVQWRVRHGLSLAQAAQALGLSVRTVSAYGTGARPVPRYMALACRGWDAMQTNQARRTPTPLRSSP